MKKYFVFLIVLAAAVACSKENPSGGGSGKAPASAVAVDLGLSVKWANCNVGAMAPEEYGSYFAWAETVSKNSFTLGTYKWLDLSSGSGYVKKYNDKSAYGKVDNKSTLDLEDDAAHVNWGGKWRIPTLAEWQELIARCTWTLETRYGTVGALATGPNGNSIFLPAAGGNDGSLSGVNERGLYWTSVCVTDYAYPTYAYAAAFNAESIYCGNNGRGVGSSVRAVCK